MKDTTLRLDKLVAKCGYGSRAEARSIIRSGQVQIDGRVIKDSGFILDPYKAVVIVRGQLLNYQANHYLMLNKPAGVISARRDQLHPTVVDLLPASYKKLNLFPVGRLDKDTKGLLLLTDDGQLAHNLLAPKKRVLKTYRALIDGQITPADVTAFATGISLSDFKALPAELVDTGSGMVEVTLCEGKFHQVKRMFQARGFEVLELERITMGPLKLDENLDPGAIRPLSPSELAALLEVGK